MRHGAAAMIWTTSRTSALQLSFGFLIALVLLGCAGPSYVTPERMDKGLVVILPGIEGPGPSSTFLRKGLAEGGLPYALEVYDWRAGRIGAEYAFDEPAARRRAREVAQRIARYRADYPGRPAFVVGHSGGGAIAVFAAEAMPAGAPLDGIVILEGALGPEYDLTCAVEASRGRLLNCHAWNDIFLRSLTTIGQNFDGTRGKTAGQDGFSLPQDASKERAAAFAKVRQIAWDASMLEDGNWGGHFGVAASPWIASTIAPVISGWAESDP
jgi:pimeloyl-ACP methyl ester carboxylesterase